MKNYLVEHHLMSGSIGMIVCGILVYKDAIGPANSYDLPAYVVVELCQRLKNNFLTDQICGS